MGDKNNTIFNDMDETLGYYKDIVALYKDLIKGATERNDTEEVKDLAEQLEEINEFSEYEDLLVLSMNNGMGFTCKKYIEEHKEPYSCINCGKPVEEPDASYCEECFRKGEL